MRERTNARETILQGTTDMQTTTGQCIISKADFALYSTVYSRASSYCLLVIDAVTRNVLSVERNDTIRRSLDIRAAILRLDMRDKLQRKR